MALHRLGNVVGGETAPAVAGRYVVSYDPVTEQPWAEVPSCSGVTIWLTRNSSATASNVSGMTKDSSITKFAPSGSRPCHRSMPRAKATPSGTVIAVARTPSTRVWTSAVCSVSSCHTDRMGSPQYQRNEKPCHKVRDRPALKEKSTAMITGSRDHTR